MDTAIDEQNALQGPINCTGCSLARFYYLTHVVCFTILDLSAGTITIIL